jgi:hypothetical protein
MSKIVFKYILALAGYCAVSHRRIDDFGRAFESPSVKASAKYVMEFRVWSEVDVERVEMSVYVHPVDGRFSWD